VYYSKNTFIGERERSFRTCDSYSGGYEEFYLLTCSSETSVDSQLIICLWLYSPLNLGRFLQFRDLYTVNRNAYRILVGKPEGKRPLGRQRRRWMDNIKMDLRETGWDGVEWTGWIWLRIGTSGGLS
jgi:hypothetical protein